MNRVRAVACLLVLVASALWWQGVSIASAQASDGTRIVEGRIINGTAGVPDPAGLTVVFHQVNVARSEELQTTTDQEGSFRFDDIVFDPEALYGISVRYQGALYADAVDLSEGSPPPVSLTVYEAVDDESLLTAPSASVLFAQVDKPSQTLWALEIVKISNGTDRTYVPGAEPMKLLRFGLPPGAQGLQVDSGLLGAEVLQVDRGFALTASVPPGEHEVMYAYQFPYSGAEYVFARSFPYGAGSLRVLAPYEVARLSSEQLGAVEEVTVGGRPYQLLSAIELPRGDRISLALRDLPEASFIERLGRRLGETRLEYTAPAGLGLLMVSLVGFALWRRSAVRRGLAMGMMETEALEAERDRLIQEIARLDDSFDGSALDEAQYRRRRETLTARMAALSRRRFAHSD